MFSVLFLFPLLWTTVKLAKPEELKPNQNTNSSSSFSLKPHQRSAAHRQKKRINQKTKKMALKFNPITSQSQKLPSFALPPMASLRSPRFFMASTLRSGSKWVFFFSFFMLVFCSLVELHYHYFHVKFMELDLFPLVLVDFGSGSLFFFLFF